MEILRFGRLMLQINPEHVPDENVRRQNIEILKQLAQSTMTAIFNSAANCPPAFRSHTCHLQGCLCAPADLSRPQVPVGDQRFARRLHILEIFLSGSGLSRALWIH